MAHYSIPEPDPDPDDSDSSGELRSERIPHYGSASEPVDFEADLAELTSKFASEECGHLSAELSADLALQVVLNEIVEQACVGTGAGGAAIILEREGEWVCRASAGASAPELGARSGNDSGLIAQCIKTGRVQRCDDAITDLRVDIAACRALGVRSLIALPLVENENLVGVFAAFSPQASAFGEPQERMLDALARCVIGTMAQAADPEVNLARPQEPRFEKVPQIAEVPRIREENEDDAVLSIEEEILAILARDEAEATPQVQDGEPERGEAERGEIDKSELILAEMAPECHPAEASLPAAEAEKSDAAVVEEEILPGRGMSIATWVLGAAVLAVAAFVITISGERLLGTKAPAAHRAPVAASSQQNLHAGDTRKSDSASGSSPAFSLSGVQSVKNETQDAAEAAKNSARPTHLASPPTGSLAVFENGKEVFRMPAAEMRHSDTADTAAGSVKRAGIYELAPKDADKNVIQRVEPDYPEAAREQQIQGAVVLEVMAGPDGRVQEVTPISGPAQLVDSAIGAVKQWQFRPHLENGKPLPIATRITLNFRLPQ